MWTIDDALQALEDTGPEFGGRLANSWSDGRRGADRARPRRPRDAWVEQYKPHLDERTAFRALHDYCA
jgi:hypothetical protein